MLLLSRIIQIILFVEYISTGGTAQDISSRPPVIQQLVKDITEDPNILNRLNSSNNYPEKYSSLQVKSKYLARTTKIGEL